MQLGWTRLACKRAHSRLAAWFELTGTWGHHQGGWHLPCKPERPEPGKKKINKNHRIRVVEAGGELWRSPGPTSLHKSRAWFFLKIYSLKHWHGTHKTMLFTIFSPWKDPSPNL